MVAPVTPPAPLTPQGAAALSAGQTVTLGEEPARIGALFRSTILKVDGAPSPIYRPGGVLYCFLRGMRPGDNEAGTYFRRPEWPTVLDWQTEMLGTKFWGLP